MNASLLVLVINVLKQMMVVAVFVVDGVQSGWRLAKPLMKVRKKGLWTTSHAMEVGDECLNKAA